MTLAIVMSEISQSDMILILIIITLPILQFSTLTFTSVITFTSNIMVVIALLATSEDTLIVY